MIPTLLSPSAVHLHAYCPILQACLPSQPALTKCSTQSCLMSECLRYTDRIPGTFHEPSLRDRDISPYNPGFSHRRQPRDDSGYNSRDYSLERDSPLSDPCYDHNPIAGPSYLNPPAPRSSNLSTTEKSSSRKSTGHQSRFDGVPANYRPSRRTEIHNNDSVIHNESDYVDHDKRTKEIDARYHEKSSQNWEKGGKRDHHHHHHHHHRHHRHREERRDHIEG